MVCLKCNNWKCEELTYDEVVQCWEDSIGGIVTPGILQRYRKEATRLGKELSEVRIGYKYCAEGILTRFYVMKGASDCKPVRKGEGCLKFSGGNYQLKYKSKLLQICATETHGPSEVNGIRFTTGLYENQTYTRVPMYGSVMPTVETGISRCSICDKESRRSIKVRIEKTFCSNEHYLEWWAKKYRDECRRLHDK
ncbi:hypothetical protein [Desulforhopalus sp. 52FAK]